MDNDPRPYDLNKSGEIARLHREVYGYLLTCIGQHHGTDRPGRQYALEALKQLTDNRL
jgi:hypothetical protein